MFRNKNHQTEGCNEVCLNGGTISNSGSSCICETGYTGNCCTNRITCGNPENLINGVVNYEDTYYGDNATYACNQHYNLTGGSDVRTCQLNATWSGQKPFCAYVNHCGSQPCQNGAQCKDLLDDYECACQTGWSGRHCENRTTCGNPDNLINGVVNYEDTYFGDNATYVCNQHYNLTGGSDVRTCQLNATWSGQKPSCSYVNHCASQPCRNGAICTDLLDDYECTCQSGWGGRHCENDIQPPVVSGCPSDQAFNATVHKLQVNWKEPTFEDPIGTDIKVTANYPTPQFMFPWGDFTVQYVATKPSNGLQTECSFQIRVRPTPCDDLNIPSNGARLCNGWKTDYGRFCMVSCQSSYTIDPSSHYYDTLYVCGASGKWMPSGPLPDCEIHMLDTADITAVQPSYAVFSHTPNCSDPATKMVLQDLFISRISDDASFGEFCSNFADECAPENVQVDC